MAINFPEPPSTSQPYTYEGVTYVWDGEKWTTSGASESLIWVRDDSTSTISPYNSGDIIEKASKPVPNVTISAAEPSGIAMEGDLWITVE